MERSEKHWKTAAKNWDSNNMATLRVIDNLYSERDDTHLGSEDVLLDVGVVQHVVGRSDVGGGGVDLLLIRVLLMLRCDST